MTTTTHSTQRAQVPQGEGAAKPRPSARTHAVGGFVFVAIEVACIAIQGGATPSRESSAATIAAYFRDHAGRVELAGASL